MRMNQPLLDFYRIPNIQAHEDIDLLALSESCAALEERVCEVIKELPEHKRLIVEEYINTRNDLELETFKTALRWGKHNYK